MHQCAEDMQAWPENEPPAILNSAFSILNLLVWIAMRWVSSDKRRLAEHDNCETQNSELKTQNLPRR
jgi:hypothetical protein